ncbi:MAG: FAD-binding protein [Coriobacteriales bacterium]|nr:FAD-binding protein [Coriobacteriales bacterium]
MTPDRKPDLGSRDKSRDEGQEDSRTLTRQGFGRRDFLKAAATAAAGVGAFGLMSGCAAGTQPGAAAGGGAAGSGAGAASANSGAYNTAEQTRQQWAFEIPPAPIPEEQIAEVIETEIVVVGCGTSGLMVANSAAEAGGKAIIVSASTKPTSRGGSNNAIYCKVFEREGLSRVSPWMIQKEIYGATHKVDQRKWYLNYNNNEQAINWAIDLMEGKGYGVTIEYGTPMEGASLYEQQTAAVGWELGEGMKPEPGMTVATGMMQPLFVKELAAHFEELGGSIYFQNVAEQLIREDGGTGRVSAVVCKRADGSYAKYVGTKAIVLATGDFSADRDMMYRYAPETAGFVTDEVYDGEPDYDQGFKYGGIYKGQGQKMGLWVGAAWQKSFPNCTMGAYWGPGPRNLYSNHLGLLMDRDGQRYMNEFVLGPMASQQVLLLPEQKSYAIWDSDYPRHEEVSGNWNNDSMVDGDIEAKVSAIIASWDEAVAMGTMVKGNTVEDVITQLDLPTAAADTVRRYNELAAAGEDRDFHKDARHLHEIKTGPFYGQMTDDFGFLTVLGGLNTNVNMQVCDADDRPIPGLYNVGTMVGDLYSGTYTFQVEGANYGMACVTFGYLTGKYIVENE